MSDVVEMVDRLGQAFLARDADAVLACFVPDDDITYAGSEAGESATGRAAVRALLAGLFARPSAYTWQATSATVHSLLGAAFVIAEADGAERSPDGRVDSFPYRITGLLSRRPSGAWLWRAVEAAEPLPTWVGQLPPSDPLYPDLSGRAARVDLPRSARP